MPRSPWSPANVGRHAPHPVSEAILARSAPTLLLHVSEPVWVQVTVTAKVVPLSLAVAETLPATVIAALERFLHPLTGRWDRQGWPFGRLLIPLRSLPAARSRARRPSRAEALYRDA